MAIFHGNAIPSGAEDYTIDYSCRFDSASSSKLSRTPSGAGNRRTYTISFWFKRGVTAGAHMYPFDADGNGDIYILTSSEKLGSQGYGSGYHTATQVLRDMSNWYHLIIAVDTTQGSASNRVKHYLNGSQITVWDSDSQPSQDADSDVNNTVAHTIGGKSGSNYFDGYIAEFHLIDGTALTPSSFGETGDYGEWKPIEYEGSHGTNGFYLDFKNTGVVYETGDRRSSITVTHSGLTVSGGTVNAMLDGVSSSYGSSAWFAASVSSGAYLRFEFDSAKVITENKWYQNTTHSGATWQWQGSNNASDWTNIGSSFQMTCSVANQGEVNTQLNGNTTAYTYYQMLYVSGSNNANPYWQEIEFATGSPAVNGLGTDASGEGNHFTPTNLASSDQVTDSPTNNFATYDIHTAGSFITLKEGNLETSWSGDDSGHVMSNWGFESGKWYIEILAKTMSTADYPWIGVMGLRTYDYPSNAGYSSGRQVGQAPDSVAYYPNTGNKVIANSYSAYGASFTAGDIIGIALDCDNGAVYFAKNGAWQASGDPTSGASKTNAALTFTSGQYQYLTFNVSEYQSVTVINFGQDGTFAGNVTAGGNADGNGYGNFKYAVPSGYKAPCSQNLPTPAVIPSENFNVVLYTGTGSTNAITGVGFQPDFVWIKNRSSDYGHQLYDAVRGVTKKLHTNNSNAETTDTTALTVFGSDGFTVVSNVGVNNNTNAHVAFCWKGGNATSGTGDFTQGSIASTCSRNVNAGFSIVSYTGTGSNGTVGHGLSKTPELLIVKNRPDAGEHWRVGSIQSMGSLDFTDYFKMNLDGTFIDEATMWNDTAPTSSVFSIGTANGTNISSSAYIAYLWHSVEGYSKVGSYRGNASTNGAFVYTGFQVSFLLFKKIDGSYGWVMQDTARDSANPITPAVLADIDTKEGDTSPIGSAGGVDFLSNGFKHRDTGDGSNGSGNKYLYLAIAESPFKHSNAR